MNKHDEVHLIPHPTGHLFSPDCWCEPHCEWVPTIDRGPFLVCRHADYTAIRHDIVLSKRNERPGWITNFLESLSTGA